MKCPKCSNEMIEVPDLPAKALRCVHCNGIWFEMLAHEHLIPFAQRIDTGSVEQGREYNRIDRIHCPACAGEQDLIRMVDSAAAAYLVRKLPELLRSLLRRRRVHRLHPAQLRRVAAGTWMPRSGRCRRDASAHAAGRPPRPTHPQLRIGVPAGSTRRNISTRSALGFTTTGARAALSSGRSALLSE